MPTRLCLKNMGDLSSIKIANTTVMKTGDNIKRTMSANKRLKITIKYPIYKAFAENSE